MPTNQTVVIPLQFTGKTGSLSLGRGPGVRGLIDEAIIWLSLNIIGRLLNYSSLWLIQLTDQFLANARNHALSLVGLGSDPVNSA